MEIPEGDPDRYGVVGHPVEHSRSPIIHQIFARQTGENLTYELIDAEPAAFEAAVRDFGAAGGKGLNVTVPHKEAAFRLATELGPEAESARAVNTLSFRADGQLRGDNTDGIGFLRDLTQNNGLALDGKRVLVLGAGGAARGILPPLLEARPSDLVLANRTLERAQELVEILDAADKLSACRFDELADQEPFHILVNATSAGLHGDTPPFPPSCLNSASFCYDLTYSLKQTPFVHWALEHGAGKAVQGWGMLIEQAAESFKIWRGTRPDTAPVLKRLAIS